MAYGKHKPTTPRRTRLPRSSPLSYWKRDALSGYLFVSPLLLGYLAFVLGPLLAVFWFSLHDWNLLSGQMSFIGSENYTRMLSDSAVRTVLRNTAVFALGVVPLNLVLGLGLALLLNQKLPGMVLFRTLFFTPMVVSLVAWTIVWNAILRSDGAFNAALQSVGLTGPNWLWEPSWAMVAVIIVQVFHMAGFGMVLFLAALQGVPEELYEAARIDGARPPATFRFITLPLISPTVLLVTMLVTIWSLKSFSLIFLLTGGGPGISTAVLGYYIYSQTFEVFRAGFASALATVLFVIILALTLVQWQARKRWVFYEN